MTIAGRGYPVAMNEAVTGGRANSTIPNTGHNQLSPQSRSYDEAAALREAANNSTIHAYIDRKYTATPLP